MAGCNSKKHCLYFCEVTEAKNYLNLKETITHKWSALRTWKSGKQSWVVEMQMLNNYNWSLPEQFFLTGSCQYHYSPTSGFKEKWVRNKFINTSCENNTRSQRLCQKLKFTSWSKKTLFQCFSQKKNPIQQLRTIFSFEKIADIFQVFKDSRETSCTLT